MRYCDYIANLIRKTLLPSDKNNEHLLLDIGMIRYDIDNQSTFKSTKKEIEVIDVAGNKYRITVEEL